MDHARRTSRTVRKVAESTPAAMRNRSPVANTSSRAASLAGSCRAALRSTKAKRTGSFLEPFAPSVKGIFCQALVFAELLYGGSAALLPGDSFGPLLGFGAGRLPLDGGVSHDTTMHRVPAHREEGLVGRLRICDVVF